MSSFCIAQVMAEIMAERASKFSPRPNKLSDTENNARLRTGYQARTRYRGQRGRRISRKTPN